MKRSLSVAAFAVFGIVASVQGPRVPPPAPRLAVSERLTYDVSFSGIPVASADMTLLGSDSVGGHRVRRAVLEIEGGLPFFRVLDSTSSWFDSATFVSRRFVQRLREGPRSTDRDFAIDPERHLYSHNGQAAERSVASPLDDISFLYFARTLPLDSGQTYVFHRYFQPHGNPITIRVIGRERIRVPAGEFRAIVLEPEIVTGGIFAKGGQARVWLSDDSARLLLQLKSRLSFGSINLYLKTISPSNTRTTTTP